MSIEKTGHIDINKNLDPRNFKGYRGLALKLKDLNKIEQF